MLVHFPEFFILMSVFKIIEGISLNVTGSSFTKNKYSDSHVILAFDKVGPLMCVKDCSLYKGCNAVNYNRFRLDCELLSVSFPGDNITDMEGSFYTDIVGWTMVSWCHLRFILFLCYKISISISDTNASLIHNSVCIVCMVVNPTLVR